MKHLVWIAGFILAASGSLFFSPSALAEEPSVAPEAGTEDESSPTTVDSEPEPLAETSDPANAPEAEPEARTSDMPAEPLPASVPEKKPEPTGGQAGTDRDGFGFGTYGRIQFSSDFEGRPGKEANVVAHGPRLMQGPYAEFDLKYRISTDDGFFVRGVTTVAFFEEFFHFDGEAAENIAMRNFFAETGGFLPIDLRLWIGSRMYRGDDIYLLDFWPLDQLNTYGGGVIFTHGRLELKTHVGANRLTNDYQLRTVSVPGVSRADEIVVMERQRYIVSLKGSYLFPNLAGDFSMKIILYGEVHHLPKGTYHYSKEHADYFETSGLDLEAGYRKALPDDHGVLVGLQVGMWGFGSHSHLNLFARYAQGLAAYGEWGVPFGFDSDLRTWRAKEWRTAFSFNWESRWVGIMAGGYLRYFKDADRNRYDLDDFWEGALAVRPGIFATRHFHQLFEISHQWKRPNGLDPNDHRRHVPQNLQFAVMPTLSLDRGMYQRPQFRLVYAATYLNAGSRNLYPRFDERRDQSWQHYFGIQVEWWLDSEGYR